MRTSQLREVLKKHFNITELKDLCYDLGLDYENLSGDNKVAKVDDLVNYCERHKTLDQLMLKIKQKRPELAQEIDEIWSNTSNRDRTYRTQPSESHSRNSREQLVFNLIRPLLIVLLAFGGGYAGYRAVLGMRLSFGPIATKSATQAPEPATPTEPRATIEPATAAPGAPTALPVAPPSEPPTASTPGDTSTSGKTILIGKERQSSIDNFTLNLTMVEILDDRMRWHFEFWNQTDRDLQLGFNYGETYITDEKGQQYNLIGVDTKNDPEKTFKEPIKAGVKVTHWFDFALPSNGARTFNIRLYPWTYNSDVTFDLLRDITLDT